jgi:hypothetical protein
MALFNFTILDDNIFARCGLTEDEADALYTHLAETLTEDIINEHTPELGFYVGLLVADVRSQTGNILYGLLKDGKIDLNTDED